MEGYLVKIRKGWSQCKPSVRTGDGRCSREAAMRSPGDSNATTGFPKVTPIKLASAPPREWPMIQIVASGLRENFFFFFLTKSVVTHYMNVILL